MELYQNESGDTRGRKKCGRDPSVWFLWGKMHEVDKQSRIDSFEYFLAGSGA